MMMATGEGLPPPTGCQNGSRLVFGGYGGFWQRNSQSTVFPKVFSVYGYIWEEEVRRWTSGRSTRQGARPGGGRAPLPRAFPVASLTCTPSPLDYFRSKNNSPERFIPFGLRLIFLFCETLKQGKKQKLALGSGLIS